MNRFLREMEVMNNKKGGITLVALAITLIVMGILISITVVSTDGIMKESNARKFASELKQLEYLVKQNKILNNNEEFNFVKRTLLVSDLSDDEKDQMASELADGSTQIELYELGFNTLDIMDTTYGKKEKGEDDVYVLSYKTGNIYYLKGFKWEGVTYYTLTGKLKELVSN